MRRIVISAGNLNAEAELNETPSAEAVWNALPIEARANTWGDEIYFEIPVEMGSEPGASPNVEVGDLAYWPPGNAFCVFFGPTPASRAGMPRAASAVNHLGRVIGEATDFRSVRDGDSIRLSRME
jgi:hypothetical protein